MPLHDRLKPVTVKAFNMPYDSKKFNKGQIVFIREMETCMAAKVVGKFRGDGNFVNCWVSWDCGCRDTPAIYNTALPKFFVEDYGIELVAD